VNVGTRFTTRLIEMHSASAWDFDKVMQVMDIAVENAMTGICFHRNDFVDQLLFPTRYLGSDSQSSPYSNLPKAYDRVYRAMYRFDPTRRDQPYRRGLYFRRVLHEAADRHLDVYIENKEVNYLDFLDELYPHLRKNGPVCPSEPFLLEYVAFKYRELFALYPEVAGIITSTATRESKTTISNNHCTCSLCAQKASSEWHRDVIMTMHQEISKAGKRLIVRDFVFDAAAHQEISGAMQSLPTSIAFSLKNTPHDYYPTFPDNPRIGQTPEREQWIEYDANGQYFGQGIAVSIMKDDLQRRIEHAKANGVSGMIIRTDWEAIDGHAVFATPNFINVYLACEIERGSPDAPERAYSAWLAKRGFFTEGLTDAQRKEAVAQVMAVYDDSFEILRRTAYVHDCVFNDSSQFPASIAHGLWLAEEKNSLKDWDATKEQALSVEDFDNLTSILAEKDEAVRRIEACVGALSSLGSGISADGKAYIAATIVCYHLYVSAYRHLTYGMFLTRYFELAPQKRSGAMDAQAKQKVLNALASLREVISQIKLLHEKTHHYYMTYILLDYERLQTVHQEIVSRLEKPGLFEDALSTVGR